MPWRKWLVRSLVFTIVGACAAVALVYQRWTNPAAVREQVIGKLQSLYPGAVISLDSARMRLLGGIIVNELRLTRKDDNDKDEFAHVPSAILYHDKEKILDGQMVLRKVELHHPRLRVVRERDGSWNLQGILGESQLHLALPTVVVHQGTLIFEDKQEGSSGGTLEIGDINMSFINDPLATVAFSGAASSEMLGLLHVKGDYQRGVKDLALNLKAKAIPLRPALLQRLPFACPNNFLADLNLVAKGDLEADVAYRPKETNPLEYNVLLQLSKGKLQHPKIPLPLTEVQGALECNNGMIRLKNFQARSGEAVVKGHASTMLPSMDQFFDANLEIKHLMLDNELAARLPEKIRNLQQAFQATGKTTVRLACSRRGGQWTNPAGGGPSQISMQPENFHLCFVKFPYPVENVTGKVDWNLQSQLTKVDVTGYAQNRPVTLRGTWQGEGLQAEGLFELQSNHLLLEDKLVAALPPRLQKLTNSFHPTGTISVKSLMQKFAGSPEFHNQYHITMQGGNVCWDDFPYPLQNVSALLDVYPRRWELREGQGSFQGGQVKVKGKSLSRDSGPSNPGNTPDEGLFLEITGREMVLDEHLYKALGPMPQMVRAWDTFHPRGRLNFSANIVRFPEQPPDMDIRAEVIEGAMEPTFFPYPLTDLSGQFLFHKNRLQAVGVQARHNNTRLELDQGTVDLRPGGGHYTDLHELRVTKLLADQDLIRALPKSLQTFVTTLDIKDPLDVKTRLVVSQSSEAGSSPEVWWDGQVLLKGIQLNTGITWDNIQGTLACTGKHNGRQLEGLTGNFLLDQAVTFKQPLKKVHGKFHVRDDTPEIFNLSMHAPIFGGDITGQVRMEFTSSLRYELNLTASQINLKDFGLHNLGPASQLNGVAVARLHLTGMGANTNTLDGNGSIDIPNGRLYNLPLLLDLLKFLGLRWPDRTAFEELHALFSIHGPQVTMRRLDLTGNAISLSGKGTFNLDGTDLNLDFYPSWARVEQLLPPAIRTLPPTISKNLLTIEMRGKVSSKPEDLKFNKKLVPLLTDPFFSVRDRVVGPNNPMTREKINQPAAPARDKE